MGRPRELPSGKIASQSKAVSQIPVGRELFNFADFGKGLGKELLSWKRAFQSKGSFLLGSESVPVGR